MASFYSNENFPQGTVEALRQLGHDVLTSHDAGMSRQSIKDPEVLKFATEQDRIVLTLNRLDFIKLHNSTSGHHAGIVVCTQDLNYAALAQRIHETVTRTGSLDGQLLRVNRPNA
ncbi:MAG: DUF5615 family PIN-like protein [Verrucomicrobiia bacterium]